jgi:hypothetical protein
MMMGFCLQMCKTSSIPDSVRFLLWLKVAR